MAGCCFGLHRPELSEAVGSVNTYRVSWGNSSESRVGAAQFRKSRNPRTYMFRHPLVGGVSMARLLGSIHPRPICGGNIFSCMRPKPSCQGAGSIFLDFLPHSASSALAL